MCVCTHTCEKHNYSVSWHKMHFCGQDWPVFPSQVVKGNSNHIHSVMSFHHHVDGLPTFHLPPTLPVTLQTLPLHCIPKSPIFPTRLILHNLHNLLTCPPSSLPCTHLLSLPCIHHILSNLRQPTFSLHLHPSYNYHEYSLF